MIDNGEITRYTLTVTFYTNDTIVYRGNKTAVNNDDYYEYSPTVIALKQSNNVLYIEYRHVLLLFLVQYVPYNVSVTAFTSAGEGPEVKTTAFTKQGGL